MEQSGRNQMNELGIGLNEIKENFIDDFVQEILEILDSIELKLVNLEVDPDNMDYLNETYCNFHTIKGLIGFLDENIAVRITEDTEGLLGACRMFNISITRNTINIVLQSVLFLRKICNDVTITENIKFQGEVEQHQISIKQLRDEIMMDVKQPIRRKENRIGEILAEDGAINQQDIEDVLEKQSNIYKELKFGEIAIREKKVDTGELIKAIRAQKIRNEVNEQYVKIPIKRLDQILDIVKNQESIQDHLYHESVLRFGSNDSFTVQVKQEENATTDIKKILYELRLVTLQHSFQKLTRAVRAMIEDKGLHVVFSTIGENIELDKEISEELIIPLAEIVELLLLDFSNNQDRIGKKMGSIEVVAYKHMEKVILEISSNIEVCESTIRNDQKMKEISEKIEKLKGCIKIEGLAENGENGLIFKITLPLQY